MSDRDFISLPVFTVLPAAVNQDHRQAPPGTREAEDCEPFGVSLKSGKHSALTWSVEINMTWRRERKQMAECGYINIFSIL